MIERPIVIIGCNRSGTTLLFRNLSMHLDLWNLIPGKIFQRPVGRFYKPDAIRLDKKTPANSLRIPMLALVFPDARFVCIVRRGEDVVSSLTEGWRHWSGSPDREDSRYTRWNYLVPPPRHGCSLSAASGARIAGRPYLRVIHIAAVCAGAASIGSGKEPTISVSTTRAGRSSQSRILLGA